VQTKTDPDLTDPSNTSLPGRTWQRLVLYLSIYALTIILASLLWQHPVTLTLAYGLLSLLLLMQWHSRSEVVYFGLAALLGPLGEFVAVSFGAWEYSLPWVNIPIWLPLAWGIAGLFLNKIAGLLLADQARLNRSGT
jgi:hypothetical protein